MNTAVLGVIEGSHVVGNGYIEFITIFHHQLNHRPPPLTIPACPDQCQTTQCNACYYSENSLETPSRCDGRACIGSKFTRCLKNWALCVEWADRRQNKVNDIHIMALFQYITTVVQR